jgi:hypothetical protein
VLVPCCRFKSWCKSEGARLCCLRLPLGELAACDCEGFGKIGSYLCGMRAIFVKCFKIADPFDLDTMAPSSILDLMSLNCEHMELF